MAKLNMNNILKAIMKIIKRKENENNGISVITDIPPSGKDVVLNYYIYKNDGVRVENQISDGYWFKFSERPTMKKHISYMLDHMIYAQNININITCIELPQHQQSMYRLFIPSIAYFAKENCFNIVFRADEINVQLYK